MSKNNKIITPRGRSSIPYELLQFGRHLVYSEGTKTEPYYVSNINNNIAKKYKCKPNDIEIIIGTKDKSYSTLGLVEYAINDCKRRIKNGEIINHIWIMYDKDDFEKDVFINAYNKINSLNNSKDFNDDGFKYNSEDNISYHPCWSNEAFELWLCLYFHYYDSKLNREA